ncbi:hypothetical protein J4Q44_G00390390, partial [Coregonus suidteri]
NCLVIITFNAVNKCQCYNIICAIKAVDFIAFFHIVKQHSKSQYIPLIDMYNMYLTGILHINQHFCKCARFSRLASLTVVPGQVDTHRKIQRYKTFSKTLCIDGG